MPSRAIRTGCTTAVLALLMLAWSVQTRAVAPIEDHYHGATLFVVKTGNVVWPPIAVSSLAQYESVYGRTPGATIDHGYQAARLFFANGGESLYIIDPQGTQAQDFADALAASAGLPVDLVALPGAACCSTSLMQHVAMMSALSQHVDASPNRFGLLDAPLDSDAAALQTYRAAFTSEHAALYAPWLVLDGPDPGNRPHVPPSAAVAGVISRIDRQEGVHKAPAGPVANLFAPPATNVARAFSATEQGALNAANVNLLGHFVSPLTVHIWGARTTRNEPDRRYISVARLLRQLEYSIKRSLALAFDNPPTSTDATATESAIRDYLHGYWQQGALQGTSANQAYWVSCTLASPGLSCTVAVAAIRPTEFQVFQLAIPHGERIFASGFEAGELARP